MSLQYGIALAQLDLPVSSLGSTSSFFDLFFGLARCFFMKSLWSFSSISCTKNAAQRAWGGAQRRARANDASVSSECALRLGLVLFRFARDPRVCTSPRPQCGNCTRRSFHLPRGNHAYSCSGTPSSSCRRSRYSRPCGNRVVRHPVQQSWTRKW